MEINLETVKMIDSFKKLSESIHKLFDSNEKSDLSMSETKLIETIDIANKKGELVNTSDIANNLRISKSAVSQCISKLERKGYIRRKINLKDKKIGYLYLTDACKTKYEEKKAKCNDIVARVIKHLGEDKIYKISNLIEELNMIVENIKEEKVC